MFGIIVEDRYFCYKYVERKKGSDKYVSFVFTTEINFIFKII